MYINGQINYIVIVVLIQVRKCVLRKNMKKCDKNSSDDEMVNDETNISLRRKRGRPKKSSGPAKLTESRRVKKTKTDTRHKVHPRTRL